MLPNSAPTPREGDAESNNASSINIMVSHSAAATHAPRNAPASDVVVEGASSYNNSSGAAHAESDAVETVSPDARDSFGVQNRHQRRRTMGEVYPIMKNTIYSDDECEEEVALTAWDCGALFIRYINGLFQYFVRNPKTMGLIFTTVILLLFLKYSQQQVVKVVNTAVKAHPGLEPTDTLRSAVACFTEELRALERVAQTVAWSYNRDSVVGYDVTTAVNTTFFALVKGLQYTFASNVKTYVVYALPNASSSSPVTDALTAHWGQIGCSTEGKRSPMCFYVSANHVAREWGVSSSGSDSTPDREVNETVTDVYVEQRMPELLTVVSMAKKGSTPALTGVWTRPSMINRIFSDKSVRTISYLLPVTYNAEGYATALAGVDVSVETLMKTVNVAATPNIELVVVDNRYNTSEGGQFVYDSFEESLFWSTPYGVRNTPVHRINALAEPIFLNNGSTLATNASFYQNGLIYQSLTMMDHWTLIATSPLALSVAEAVASLESVVKGSQSIAKTAASLYRNCEASANTKSDSMSVEAFAQIEHAFGTQLHSLYVAYTLSGASQERSRSSTSSSIQSFLFDVTATTTTNTTTSTTPELKSTTTTSETPTATTTSTASVTSTSTTPKPPAESSIAVQADTMFTHRAFLPRTRYFNTAAASANGSGSNGGASSSSSSVAVAVRKWGVCGCSYSSSSSNTTCFYTDSNQLETIFKGSVLSESPAKTTWTQDFTTSRRSNFTKANIDGARTTAGFWTVPYVSNDTVTGEVFVALSYVYPSMHTSNGTVSRAVILDTTATWMMQALKMNQHAGTTGLYFIDCRDTGIFLASSTQTAAVKEVYPALNTPYNDFNKIAQAVHNMAGKTWEKSLSFHMDGTLVNYQVVLGQWGVIEVMPGETALQRYLSTPAVESATDAIRLLPLNQTVELFLYVASILLLYFLNLLILGCSKLGKK